PKHPFRGGVEHADQRPEGDDEGVHDRRDAARERLSVLDRVELGHDLTDRALEEDDQYIGDDRRYGHGHGIAVAPEERLKRVRDDWLTQSTDTDRRHGDPNLARGEVVADLIHVREREASPARALLRPRLQRAATR